jgi:ABC-type sugar transport system ATPase subunit
MMAPPAVVQEGDRQMAFNADEVVLEVRGAEKRFGAVVALGGVDLTVHKGEIVALLGDNGAGKSTLIKAINGIHVLDVGTIAVAGHELRGGGPQEAKQLGIETVYQDLALFDNLDVGENLFVGRELTRPRFLGPFGFVRRRAMDDRAKEMLADLRVGIPDAAGTVGLMSGGQRQAIAVARAQAFASNLVMLDEPTAALGLRESRAVLDLIKRLPERGVGVVVVSHNMEHVAEIADRAIVMRRGRVVGEAVPTPENHERIVGLIVGSHRG